jgi:hypothetical protein
MNVPMEIDFFITVAALWLTCAMHKKCDRWMPADMLIKAQDTGSYG